MVCNWHLESEPGSPEYNMAVDTELLAALAEGHEFLPTIRIYQWDRPSVSVGRLQPEEAVRAYYPGLPLVRRPTGGRAVRHGEDLTISIAILVSKLPEASGKTVLASYRYLAAPLIAALSEAGHILSYGAQTSRGQKAAVDCFETSAGCDLVDVSTGLKVVGSAQRRVGPALLQQMSLPLRLVPHQNLFISRLQMEYEYSLQIHSWQQKDK